ncbi:MAG: ABC transporter ATP-binding protein [Candidatus Aureabacteria bacterium]|nr:ABC transporter ATP-binding protein [Candidatus Auribacterota bacterium]
MLRLIQTGMKYGGYGSTPFVFEALKNVNLEIAPGEAICIKGPSGSGKSTLLNILGGMLKPTEGEYQYQGESVYCRDKDELAELRNRDFGFVFQTFVLMSEWTVWENAALPLKYSPRPKSVHASLIRNALSRVGLTAKQENLAKTLSGGEQQRTAIARAIVNDPRIILADEPTGNLDSASGNQILDLLFNLSNEGKTVVVITHDPSVAARFPRTICIMDGQIVEDHKI